MELLEYEVNLVKLDFNMFKKNKSFSTKLSFQVILPGFVSLFGTKISFLNIFFYRWILKFKKLSKTKHPDGLVSKKEKNYLRRFANSKYDAVIVDYFNLAEILPLFSCKKIIVTHDVWHQHYSVGKSDSYFGRLTAVEEKRLLEMGDLVFAISKRDKKIFDELELDNVKVVSHPPLIKPNLKISSELIHQRFRSNTIIFVGSNYRPNVFGLEWFIKEVWPLLNSIHHKFKLLVIGNVKKYINPEYIHQYPNIEFLGFVDDLPSFYQNPKMAISPLLEGTGVKIKNIEAIEYGLPVVTTSVGAQGLERFINRGLLIADTPKNFAEAIIKLCDNDEFFESQMLSFEYSRKEAIAEQNDLLDLKNLLIKHP
jgi:glycosyltransferase involved in cell wall biosynthesis